MIYKEELRKMLEPWVGGAIVGGIILLAFLSYFVIVGIQRSKQRHSDKKSLPVGGDTSHFSETLSRKWNSTDVR